MAQRLTIQRIAELAGVSAGTVDRVIHNRGKVSPEALAAVQAVLDKQAYKYNLHTSAVAFKKTKKSFWIAVGIPSSSKGEYWDLIRAGLEKAFTEYGDISIRSQYIYFDQFNSLSCRQAFEKIANLPSCSAVILGTTFVQETRDLCEKLDKKKIPYVFVDGNVPDTHPLACFMADQRSCGRLLARLMDGFTTDGAEIVAMLPERVGTRLSNNSAIRLEAIRSYFKESGSGKILKESYFPTDNPEGARQAVSHFLRDNPKVKGIAVVISTGYLISDALSEAGISGICVGGFDVTEGNTRCIREGTLDFLINQHPEWQAFNALECLLHYLLYGATDNELRTFLPIDIVFKENLPFWHDIL